MVEDQVPGRPPVGVATPVVAPLSGCWLALSVLFGTTICANHWAHAHPEMSLDTFLAEDTRGIGVLLVFFVILVWPGVYTGRTFQGLRSSLFIIPVYLVGWVPSLVSLAVEWKGGWMLGTLGGAAGVAAGAAMGWMLTRWTLPEADKRPKRARNVLPVVCAVPFACYVAYVWGTEWLKPEQTWAIGVCWLALAMTGALVGRPLLGLAVWSPFVLVPLVPTVASITVGWEGGWILGTAGAVLGAASGVATGLIFNRRIMPEYDKLHAREKAARMPNSTDGPESNGQMV